MYRLPLSRLPHTRGPSPRTNPPPAAAETETETETDTEAETGTETETGTDTETEADTETDTGSGSETNTETESQSESESESESVQHPQGEATAGGGAGPSARCGARGAPGAGVGRGIGGVGLAGGLGWSGRRGWPLSRLLRLLGGQTGRRRRRPLTSEEMMNRNLEPLSARRLDAYRVALELLEYMAPRVQRIRRGDKELAGQLQRSLPSIVHNLSEAMRRTGGDRAHLLTVSLGSADEARSSIDIARVVGLLPAADAQQADALADRFCAMVYRLRQRQA